MLADDGRADLAKIVAPETPGLDDNEQCDAALSHRSQAAVAGGDARRWCQNK